VQLTPEQGVPDGAARQFRARGGELCCEDLTLSELAARFGTPLYVYSRAAIVERYEALRRCFGPAARICFAVKSCSNLSILRLLHSLGAGFDLVSGGELARLAAAGVPATGSVFAGVAKQSWEIEKALSSGIEVLNLESPHELPLLEDVASRLGRRAPVALRLNPDVDAGTHAYIATGRSQNKFGFDFANARAAVAAIRSARRIDLVGYHVHLGSLIRSVDAYAEALARVEAFLAEDRAHRDGLRFYDMGGGFGISYGRDAALSIEGVAAIVVPRVQALGLELILEPGRFLVAEAGALVVSVLGRKRTSSKGFLLVDGAMNDLLRPALYDAWHPIVPVRQRTGPVERFDVVGPVCESGDFLGKDRDLPAAEPGDLLAVLAAGAYGASMASNYNTRPRPAEVLVSGSEARLIRRRERLEELWAQEREGLEP
jgi:diaminopimelate decarboxylase